MATNNAVNTGLSGATGTGSFVGSTSPTLTTPTIGAATATSLVFSPTTGGIIGTTTNNNADAGKVGEFVSSVILVGSAVALTTNTTANITSVSLTAGDWDIYGELWTGGTATAVIQKISAGITATSATMPTTPSTSTSNILSGTLSLTVGTDFIPIFDVSPCRISLSGTTTIYLVANNSFTTEAVNGYGKLCARRVR